MHNLSMTQALGIWSELEAAFYSKNNFGGDTVEIYAYRLMPRCPTAEKAEAVGVNPHQSDASILGEALRDTYRDAARSLRSLILFFEESHANVRVLVRSETGLVPAAVWLSDNFFSHRIHVQVVRGA